MDWSNKRSLKIKERDERIKILHEQYPELENLDRKQNLLVFKLLKEGIHQPDIIKEIDREYQELEKEKEKFLHQHKIDISIYAPNWDCPICEDRGYIKPGKTCICKIKHDQDKRIRTANLPMNAKRMTFDTFCCEYYDNPQDVLNKVERLKIFIEKLRNKEPMGNLILKGSVGRGKTHLAIAVANSFLEKGGEVLYYKIGDLMEALRQEKFDDSKMKNILSNKLIDIDLLIIDDLGRESISGFVITQLTDIIERRNENNKSWIVITNLSINEIEDLYGLRLNDRLIDKSSVFNLKSTESIRLKNINKGVELI